MEQQERVIFYINSECNGKNKIQTDESFNPCFHGNLLNQIPVLKYFIL